MPDAVGPVAAGGADIGLAVAGMWLVGSAAVPDSPAAERLAAGLLLVVGAAWLLMAQPLLDASLVGHAVASARVAGHGLVRVAICHFDPYALGRFVDADYTLYRGAR